MTFNVASISSKQVLTIILGLGALAAYPIYRTFLYKSQPKLAIFTPFEQGSITELVNQIVSEGSTVADTLQEQLDNEFNQLLADVQKAFPLTPEAWKKTLDELENLKKNDSLFTDNPIIKHEKGDHPLVKKSRELLASYNIDPNAVMIQTIDQAKNSSYAFAGQCVFNNKVEHYLQINLAQMPQQTASVQDALLRHEIMHLMNYDPLTFSVIEDLFRANGINSQQFWANDAYRALNKHIEFRADLMAATYDVAVAQALKDGFEEHMKRYNDAIESKSHPTCKRRQDAIDNLVHYMKAENQLVTA